MRRFITLSLVALVPFTAGCASAGRNTTAGTLLGAAIGAGTGAIVGHQVGHRGPGAVIGGAAGALTGALVGSAIDRSEEDNAIRTAAAEERAEQALREARYARAEPPLSILDVIRLSQAGVSASVIMAKIDASGSAYDLSSQDIIDLRRSGVSDAVVEHMLRRPAASTARVVEYQPAPTRTVYRETTYRTVVRPVYRPWVRTTYWWCD